MLQPALALERELVAREQDLAVAVSAAQDAEQRHVAAEGALVALRDRCSRLTEILAADHAKLAGLPTLAAAPATAGHREQATLESAAEVIRTLPADPLSCIPPVLLRDAHAVAVIPHVVKAGFLVDGRFGRGVLVVRRPDGSWGDPVFVVLAGGGLGLQSGVQSTDVVLLFRTASSIGALRAAPDYGRCSHSCRA